MWTTFNSWQWDLNWHNPDVFYEFADLILWLANLGVECLRLDAIAFLFKRLGTNCQNQPEVHAITQALRVVTRIAAPAMIFLAEAIVGPADLAPYLGVGKHAGKVSDLAYQNSLMVQMQIWSALAAQDTRLLTAAMNRFAAKPPSTVWGTYLRCHDDIGWAIDDTDAASVGLQGFEHRKFLAEFYAGLYPMSDARGLVFQENLETGDRRISGTAAALVGIESALATGDEIHLDIAVRRLVLAYAVVLGFGGLPLLYMGDELALTNFYDFVEDPQHADDNRWVHRPPMPWDRAGRRHEPGTVEHRVWHGLRHLITVRASLPALDASIESDILDPVNPAVLVLVRRAPQQHLVGVYNVTAEPQVLPRWVIPVGNWAWDALTEETPLTDSDLLVEGYQVRWFVAEV